MIEAAALCFNFDTGYQLRDYQEAAVMAGVDYFRDTKANHGALMILPTGSGKSLYLLREAG